MEWNKTEEYYIGTSSEFKFTGKCAGFDLDQTLITTKSCKRFPVDKNDWKFMYISVRDTLARFHKKGYCIIIVSNQSRVTSDWTEKIDTLQHEIKVPVKVFCATSYNKYRKPLPCFYREFIFDFCKKGFFCGDACGREYDFNDTDYKFALNCNLDFKTPEEIFTDTKQTIPSISYEPHEYIEKSLKNPTIFDFTPNEKEIIIMVGYPASGKSFIAQMIHHRYNYEIINQDTQKTKSKMLKLFHSLVEQNKSIIIDNTNTTPEIRKQFFVDGYNMKCIFVNSPMYIIKHNNMFRCFKENIYIPEIVYKKKLIEPTKKEGFNEIIETQCNIPSDDDYKLYLV
jgi:bifunctional polynucleotide phosphatase/kinase